MSDKPSPEAMAAAREIRTSLDTLGGETGIEDWAEIIDRHFHKPTAAEDPRHVPNLTDDPSEASQRIWEML